MRSVVSCLGTTEFPRIRIGTKPTGEYDILSYVLSDIRKEDEPLFKISVNKAVSAADELIRGVPVDAVMCKYNG